MKIQGIQECDGIKWDTVMTLLSEWLIIQTQKLRLAKNTHCFELGTQCRFCSGKRDKEFMFKLLEGNIDLICTSLIFLVVLIYVLCQFKVSLKHLNYIWIFLV